MAALFAAIVAYGLRGRRLPARAPVSGGRSGSGGRDRGAGPVGLIAIAFPEGGSEPFGLTTMLPILVLALISLVVLPKEMITLRAGIAIYALLTLGCYLVPSPIGSNIARLATFIGAPLALLVWRHRPLILAVVALAASVSRLAGAGPRPGQRLRRPVDVDRLLPAAG